MANDPDHDRMLHAVGGRIQQIRQASGLTQEQVAVLANIDHQALQRAETGKSALPYGRLRRIADALEVEMRDFFDFDVDVPASKTSDELQALALYRSIPADHRELALRILKEMAKDR